MSRTPDLPDLTTFDYWQHEYWRLGQMYRELSQWSMDLERWERDLLARSRYRGPPGMRRGGAPRGRGRGGAARGRGGRRNEDAHPETQPVTEEVKVAEETA